MLWRTAKNKIRKLAKRAGEAKVTLAIAVSVLALAGCIHDIGATIANYHSRNDAARRYVRGDWACLPYEDLRVGKKITTQTGKTATVTRIFWSEDRQVCPWSPWSNAHYVVEIQVDEEPAFPPR